MSKIKSHNILRMDFFEQFVKSIVPEKVITKPVGKVFSTNTGRVMNTNTALKRIESGEETPDSLIPVKDKKVKKVSTKFVLNKKGKMVTKKTTTTEWDETDKFDYDYNLGIYRKQGAIKKLQKKIDNVGYLQKREQRIEQHETNKVNRYVKNIKFPFNKFITNQTKTFDLDLSRLGNEERKKEEIRKLINSLPVITTNITLDVGGVFYTLNEQTRQRLGTILSTENIIYQYEGTDSDAEIVEALIQAETAKFGRITPKPKNNNMNDSGFFPYTNNLPFDLSEFGVFSEVKGSNYNENCLVNAMIHSGILSKTEIAVIKTMCLNRNIPLRKIQIFADKLDILINVKVIDSRTRVKEYGNKKSKRIINLGTIEKHYFLIKPIPITSYAIKNWKQLKDKKEWTSYYKQDRKDTARYIDSFNAIKLMVENKESCLTPITNSQELYSSQYYDKVTEINHIHFEDSNFKENEMIDFSRQPNNNKIYFDFETYKKIIPTYIDKGKNKGKIIDKAFHTAYLCSMIHDEVGNKKPIFYGENCGKKMLDNIFDTICKNKKSCTLIAHNCGFDFRFIFKYLYRVETIEKGTRLLSGKGIYYYQGKPKEITVKCSYAITDMPLRKFGKAFDLEVKKEILPYDLYTEERVNSEWVDIKTCLEYVKPSDHEEYLQNCKDWNCIFENKINILGYSAQYCYMDCVVLKQGFEKFRTMMIDVTGLDIHHYLTIASISHQYLIKSGCYEDVLQMSGIIREFIQRCVVGGRTMCSDNEKQKSTEPCDDFDARSLYPSAMTRMKGFLRGKPIILSSDQMNYEFIKNQSGYFVKINITEVGIKRQFPLLSAMNQKGIRMFSNDIVGKDVYIDKTGLEDAIRFQDIKFDIVMGVYYNEGHNEKIREVMSYLYNERLKQKDLDNPIQAVYKLLMNSGYGKSILKPIDTEIKYISFDRIDDFIHRYYNFIKSYELSTCGKKYKVKVYKGIDDHFNNAHVGVEVLSSSKRIMNEVMCLAEDLSIPIFYQDTDSMHLPSNLVQTLAKHFKLKYHKDLIGSKTGQFHTDFELSGAKNIYAEKSIFLGKKSYIDVLVGTEEETGKVIRGYHIRMKGIPTKSVKHKAHELNITPYQLYQRLYDGEEIEFDLLKGLNDEGHIENTPKFEMNNNMTISVKNQFLRKVKF